jgi:hypothetical protein
VQQLHLALSALDQVKAWQQAMKPKIEEVLVWQREIGPLLAELVTDQRDNTLALKTVYSEMKRLKSNRAASDSSSDLALKAMEIQRAGGAAGPGADV